MLEVLGIDGNFGIFEKEEVHVNNVTQEHKMNIIIETYSKQPYLLLNLEFSSAYDRVSFEKIIRSLGYLQDYQYNNEIYSLYDIYFSNLSKPFTRYGEYRRDNILTLDRRLKSYNKDDVQNLIESILLHSNLKDYLLTTI